MAKIIKNKLANRAKVKVFKLRQEDIAIANKDIQKHYLLGNIILIENFRIPIDLTIFDFPSLPEVDLISKNYGLSTVEKNKRDEDLKLVKPFAALASKNIHKDPIKAKTLYTAMKFCESYLAKIFDKIFYISHTRLNSRTSWRFAKTGEQNYHFDNYAGISLRAFWNLSNEPRVWGFGHRALDVFDEYLVEFLQYKRGLEKKNKNLKLSQTKINNFLNLKLPTLENHKIEFSKFDLWICDSVKVAHQIIGGDKLVAFSYVFNNSEISNNLLNKLDFMNYLSPAINDKYTHS